MSEINLIAFGTFGNPHGFRQSVVLGSNNILCGISTFDINTNAMMLFPNSSLFAIRGEVINGKKVVAYSKYSFAKERNSGRNGTFIGTSVLYVDKLADEEVTIDILNKFHESVYNSNVFNDVIKVNHSDELVFTIPEELNTTQFNFRDLEDLNFSHENGRTLLVLSHTKKSDLTKTFKDAYKLMGVYRIIYFTDNRELANFAKRKNIFKVVDTDRFKEELIKVQDEKKRKIEQKLNELEKKLKNLEEDKSKALSDFNSQIELSEKNHKENALRLEESKRDVDLIKKNYSTFADKIRQLSKKLESGAKFEYVKGLYNENERDFVQSLEQIRPFSPVKGIKKPKVNTSIKTSSQIDIVEDYPKSKNDSRRSSNTKDQQELKRLKLALVFFIGAILGFGGHLLIKDDNTENSLEAQALSPEVSREVERSLNPKPNAELKESEVKLLEKKFKQDSKIDSVVELIFLSHGSDIALKYRNQSEEYKRELYKKNKNCFFCINGDYYFVRDRIKHIPIYKDGTHK